MYVSFRSYYFTIIFYIHPFVCKLATAMLCIYVVKVHVHQCKSYSFANQSNVFYVYVIVYLNFSFIKHDSIVKFVGRQGVTINSKPLRIIYLCWSCFAYAYSIINICTRWEIFFAIIIMHVFFYSLILRIA